MRIYLLTKENHLLCRWYRMLKKGFTFFLLLSFVLEKATCSAGGLLLFPKEDIMHTVKVFKSGNSQAIRIPKEYKIEVKELYIQKIGNSIVLNPKNDPWSSFRNSLSTFSDDVFENGREQPLIQERESI